MNWTAWRQKAREFLLEGLAPIDCRWAQNAELFSESGAVRKPLVSPKIPAEFLKLGPLVAAARDDDRWSLLYTLVYRLNHENANLLKIVVDPDVRKAKVLAKSVSRDIHKMHAFVRFKKSEIDGREHFIAWHRPEHLSLELGAPFFVRRFGDKPWSILTPDLSAHWDLNELTFSTGVSEKDFTHKDEFDELWKSYYKSIYNPSRLNLKMMRAEMSPRYWSSMPETSLIREMVRNTPMQIQQMAEAHPSDNVLIPQNLNLAQVKALAAKCQACPWAAHSTQTVFGEGPANAELMIVGEQPGDIEDQSGRPFTGPSGELLQNILNELSIQRNSVYITNAVKHFKFSPRGKLRMHSKPIGVDMHTCKPWLEAEIALVKPRIIVALGVTAGTAVLGRLTKIKDDRLNANLKNFLADHIIVSWHPSAILRSSSPEERQMKLDQLKSDLAYAFALRKSLSTV